MSADGEVKVRKLCRRRVEQRPSCVSLIKRREPEGGQILTL